MRMSGDGMLTNSGEPRRATVVLRNSRPQSLVGRRLSDHTTLTASPSTSTASLLVIAIGSHGNALLPPRLDLPGDDPRGIASAAHPLTPGTSTPVPLTGHHGPTVRMLLVRHGHAGTKEGWADDDRLRPLDARGRRQAKHLVGVIVPMDPTRLISSPHLRCLQTMEPIAEKSGLVVEEDLSLIPNAGAQAIDLIRALSSPDPASSSQPSSANRSPSSDPSSRIVVCTHGEVIGDVLAVLAREDGVRLSRRPPGLKGCVWVLDFHKGKVATARYISPGR
jgi:broad specificity phosphatase PhoE